MRHGNSEGLNCPYRKETWSSPFTVGYLNVGRRHLVGSLQEIVQLVLRHRPGIFFLGDLVTSPDHIGRLKKCLESELHDEWFVTSNISNLSGRPIGIGAIVHCSLAKHMTDCVIPYPGANDSENEKREWTDAVGGRVQCIKVTGPGSPFTWQFVGVYQHVAKRENRTARALVRDTLAAMTEGAEKEGHRIVIVGDFNAAPPGGRWGYSKWSAAAAEDRDAIGRRQVAGKGDRVGRRRHPAISHAHRALRTLRSSTLRTKPTDHPISHLEEIPSVWYGTRGPGQ